MPALIMGELSRHDPTTGALPVDVMVVLERSGHEWRPKEGHSYILSYSEITRERALLENGVPVRVETDEAEGPPLEDFLALKQPFLRAARWTNPCRLEARIGRCPGC